MSCMRLPVTRVAGFCFCESPVYFYEMSAKYVGAIIAGMCEPTLTYQPERSIGMNLTTGEANNLMPDMEYVPLTEDNMHTLQATGVEVAIKSVRPLVVELGGVTLQTMKREIPVEF